MDEVEKSRMQRFIESPWAKVLAGAGVVGIVALTGMLLLRKRRRSREQSQQIKGTVTSFSRVSDETAALIDFTETIAEAVDSAEVAETAAIAAELLQRGSADGRIPADDKSPEQTLSAIAVLADQAGRRQIRRSS